VVQCLVAVVRVPTVARKTSAPREHVVRSAEGVVIARGQRAERGGAVTINLPTPTRHARSALLTAVDEILNQMSQSTREGEPWAPMNMNLLKKRQAAGIAAAVVHRIIVQTGNQPIGATVSMD
jgi:hypothetical protein